jgi:hypothetical protein
MKPGKVTGCLKAIPNNYLSSAEGVLKLLAIDKE